MKKILGILILGLILFAGIANAKITRFTKGQIYEGEVNWRHKTKLNLPPGKWEVIESYSWSYYFLNARHVAFAQMDGKRLIAAFDFGLMNANGKYMGQVAQAVYEILFMDPFDGCYERSEYTLVKVYRKGMSVNCFVAQHSDVNKELHHPDDPKAKVYSALLRKWIRENNIEVPKIMLCGGGAFFAPVVRDTLYAWDYCIDPEVFGASKNEFTTEDTSEYHPANINKYPDKKKFMDDWIKITAQRHKSFEIMVRAKERHKLDFSEYGVGEQVEETKTTNITSGSVISDEIKELKKLHEEGVLTDDEFKKAKKKILSQ